MPTKRRSQYSVVNFSTERITIRDENGDVSVTNDAELVVMELLALYGNRRIFYFDSLGNLDELCHDGTKFTHFAQTGE